MARVEVAGLGSHSFRRGCALALFHVGAGREAVTEVLRHRSLLSSGPYVTDAERVADLAVTMAAAAPSRPVPVAAVGSALIGAPGHSAASSSSSCGRHRRGAASSSSSGRACPGSAASSHGAMRAG